MANRREDLSTRVGLGATAGVLGALALRGLARKGIVSGFSRSPAQLAERLERMRSMSIHAPGSPVALHHEAANAASHVRWNEKIKTLGDLAHGSAPVMGAIFGGAGGAALHSGLHALDNVQKHHEAVQDYNAHGGAPLPFLVRHPYLTAAAAPVAGMVAGTVLGAGISRSLRRGWLEGGSLGGAVSTSLAQPIINKLTRDQRDVALPTTKLRADQGDDMQSYLG